MSLITDSMITTLNEAQSIPQITVTSSNEGASASSINHIVCLCFLAQGHMRPLMTLSDLLARTVANCQVTYIVPTLDTTEGDLPPTTEPERVTVKRLDFKDSSPPDAPESLITNHGRQFEWLSQNELHVRDTVCEYLADKPPVKAVIFDMMAAWAFLVAQKLNTMAAALMCSPLSCMYLIQFHRFNFVESVAVQDLIIPDMVTLKQHDCPTLRMGLDAFKRTLERLPQADTLLINDCITLYPPDPTTPMSSPVLRATTNSFRTEGSRIKTHLTGLLALSETHSSPSACPEISWLDGQQPNSVIFVALGSWVHLPPADVVELAWALARSNRPFLWAYRPQRKPLDTPPDAPEGFTWPEPDDELDSDKLPVGFMDVIGDRGLLVPWCAQKDVLRHPAIGCFMTHCGWNSISEAISLCGRPMLALPLDADQLFNAVIIDEYWQTGIQLWRGYRWQRRLDRQKIMDAIETAMTDHTMIEKAKNLQINCVDYFNKEGPRRLCDVLNLPANDS